eukprot:COSAG04_NODE_5182_length_1711_cov_1.728288_3_plen_106_part_00
MQQRSAWDVTVVDSDGRPLLRAEVSAPAGSVFIQDSRMWHSTACHNTSGQVRVAAQNRWIPWWFNAQYGGGEDGYGVTGWLNREDLEAMPPDLQPLFSHLCVEVS